MAEPALYARMELRIKEFEKSLAKVQRSTDSSMSGLEKRTKSAAQRVESNLAGAFKNFGKGLLAGGAAAAAGGIIQAVRSVADEMSQIAAEAKRAGVGVEAFQELGYAARQSKVSIDALTDGLKEMQLRTDEFVVTGKGPAAEAFARLGYTAAELKTKLQDPSALLAEIIGRLQKLDTAAQIRISDEIFGGEGGEQFLRFVDKGEQGIKDMAAEARKFGAVISAEMIDNAIELDRQFNVVATTVGNALKQAIVAASGALVRFIDEFNSFEDRATGSLQTRFSELQTRRGQLVGGREDGMLDSTIKGWLGKDTATEMAAIDEEMARIAAELKQRALPRLRQQLLDQAASSTPLTPPPPSTGRGGGSIRAAPRDTFDPDPEAFRNMLGYTEEYVRAQELANDRLEQFGDIALDAANSLATAFSDGKLEASEILSIVGQIAQQLLRMPGGLQGLMSLFSGGGGSTIGGTFSLNLRSI